MKLAEKSVAILGSTGSIGRQTLEVIESMPDTKVVGLMAGRNCDLLLEQVEKFQPEWAVLAEGELNSTKLGRTELAFGQEAVEYYSRHHRANIVVAAVSGVAGLVPAFNAVQSGATVALANKEALVTAGHLIMPLSKASGSRILPVDSEHSAVWQCLQGLGAKDVARLIITASGGPFRSFTTEQLSAVTVDAALSHPNWQMGSKITIDSATLMNKGLEVIEARWLFDIEYDNIDVVVHPQSIVHSMVETVDGSVLAQMSPPDMRLPIQLALTWPERRYSSWPRLDLTAVGQLTFEKPRYEAFPCLRLALQAGRMASSFPIVLNAANEVAVNAFLAGRISFTDIPVLLERALSEHTPVDTDSIARVLEVDRQTRERIQTLFPGSNR